MRKLFFSLLLLLGMTAQMSAADKLGYDWKDKRHSISLSYGSPSLISGTSGVFSSLFSGKDAQSHLYGTYGVHYGFNVLRWLRVGGSLLNSGWEITKQNENYTSRDVYYEGQLMGKADFTYLNRRYVRLYSGLGVGISVAKHNKYSTQPDANIAPIPLEAHVAFAVTPFGLEAGGKHVFGLAEINIGTAEVLRAGLGVRF